MSFLAKLRFLLSAEPAQCCENSRKLAEQRWKRIQELESLLNGSIDNCFGCRCKIEMIQRRDAQIQEQTTMIEMLKVRISELQRSDIKRICRREKRGKGKRDPT